MTPELILNNYSRDSELDAEDAYEECIEAIKDYARSMLAKQRLNMRLYAVQNKMNYRDAIENAPYPKDLQ